MTTTTPLRLALALALAPTLACSDDPVAETATKTDTGDATAGGTDASATDGPTSNSGGDTDAPTTGSADDGGEPTPPDPDTAESCDAGDEAFVKRLIPLMQGRRPEGMREVRLLVSMITQLDALGVDGRAVLARGLASGDLYVRRWRTFMWEQMRINRVEVKSNFNCYSVPNGPNANGDLAAFIRDNAALDTTFGAKFNMADVLESALRLDDISPIYRADLFARMARPLGGANISEEEFEVNARSNFGEIFESAYLGRRSSCLECHNSEESVTYNPDPKFNHFWSIPGNFERAIYGDAKGRPEAELYAMFRVTGFVVDQGTRPWGMTSCGSFDPSRSGDILADKGYLGGEQSGGQNLFDVDPLLMSGFASLAADGLDLEDNLSVAPDQALAYLTATNLVNNVWKEMMGYPLTLAHNFPRNEKQREILQTLTEAFVSEGYSLRTLLTEIALHPYFNVDAPDLCDTSTAYFLEPVFEPYAPTSADPDRRGNGVGDRVQRFSAWVLIESAMRSMWWALPVRHVGGQDQFPAIDFLRDQGAFIKDAQNGFNGVDFNGLLSWENRIATGKDPQLGGACTGPLGQDCATYQWLELMLVEASKTPGATVRDLASAIKDRLISEPTITDEAELAAIASVMGLDPATKMSEVDTGTIEDAARRFTGLILNTPQFMLSGVPSRDQDPAQDVAFAVPGTDTAALCDQLAPLVLADTYKWSCGPDGVKISK